MNKAKRISKAQIRTENKISEEQQPGSEKSKNLRLIIAALIAFVISLALYLLRIDRVVGLIVDDAWYVLLAKALATGQGYTIINSPTAGITPFYPPGFPALLSIFYRFGPGFPDNILLLKSISICAMIITGLISFLYFKKIRRQSNYISLGIAFAITIYPALVFLATSTVMSECVFTAAQMGAIYLIESSSNKGKLRSALLFTTIGSVVASYAFLTRPAGVGILIGGVIYLLKEKLIKQMILFIILVTVLVGPWLLYSRMNQPTPDQISEQGGNIVQSYTTQIWQRVAGRPGSGSITLGDMPERVWSNLEEIVRFDFGGLVFYAFFRPLEPGDRMRIPNEARNLSSLFAVLAVLGFISVVRERLTMAEIVVLISIVVSTSWGWEQFRLLLPIVGFLIFYMLMGLRSLTRLYNKLFLTGETRFERPLLLVFVWFLVLNYVYANYQYIERKNSAIPGEGLKWIAAFEENEEFFKYIKNNISKDAVIASQNPALLYLYSGHKSVASDDPSARWEVWNRIGVRYLAKSSPFPVPPPDQNEAAYKTIYRTNGRLGLRIFDLGPSSNRLKWGSKN